MARRFDRLRKRLRQSVKPVVWLRAMPGAGKSRLLLRLKEGETAAHFGDWLFLDAPTPAQLRAGLASCGISKNHSKRRLLIASRRGDEAAALLLKPRVYGFVDIVDDGDLFLNSHDCRSDADGELFAATGGWPVLVDAWICGRGSDMARILPDFLDREALSDLAQPVVTALFGALPAPLPASAVEYLFEAQKDCHPLLRITDTGMAVASHWVRDALLKLRAKPKALQRAVLDDLVHVHTTFADPEHAILWLIDIGQFGQAIEVFEAAGGMYFGYRHGYQGLEKVLDAFGPEWERRRESLFFARLYLLVKTGKSREALLRLDAQYPRLPVDLRKLRLSHRPYAVLMCLDISLDIDEPPLEVVESWGRLEALLPPGDDLARGILYNTMAIGFMQADALLQAQQLAEEALAVYQRAGSPYLAHYMLLHLCDLSLRQSRLRDATDQLRLAEQALHTSNLTYNSEPAVIESFRARIAYEEGRFEDCPTDIESILQALLRGDSWSDLILAMAWHFVFTAFWQQGLRKALDRLDHCALTLSRRHGPTQNSSLKLIRIRLYQVARRHAEAGMHLEEFDLEPPPRRSAHLEAEESLIRLRQQIVQQRPLDATLQLANSLASLPGLEARHKISVNILKAYLRYRRAEHGPARRHLSVALRNAESENLLGVLVEDGEFLERLLPIFIAEPGPGNARLAIFAQRVIRLLHKLPSAPLHSKALAGVSRQEHRVLSYLIDGYTNKQIARALTLSESAVKFHLRNLFRKLRVKSRAALCEAARQRGIMT